MQQGIPYPGKELGTSFVNGLTPVSFNQFMSINIASSQLGTINTPNTAHGSGLVEQAHNINETPSHLYT
jgi:hypothetical protein